MSIKSQNTLRKAGLKVTSTRIMILDLFESLEGSHRHLSAVDAFRLLEKSGARMGISTIHRVLAQLEQHNILKRHKFSSNNPTVYELNATTHHNHMFCEETNSIIEFSDESLNSNIKQLANKKGYELTDYTLILYVRKQQ